MNHWKITLTLWSVAQVSPLFASTKLIIRNHAQSCMTSSLSSAVSSDIPPKLPQDRIRSLSSEICKQIFYEQKVKTLLESAPKNIMRELQNLPAAECGWQLRV